MLCKNRSRIGGSLKAPNVQISGSFLINNSVVRADINLFEFTINRNFQILDKTKIKGTLDASNGNLGRGLYLLDSNIEGDFLLNSATVRKKYSNSLNQTKEDKKSKVVYFSTTHQLGGR